MIRGFLFTLVAFVGLAVSSAMALSKPFPPSDASSVFGNDEVLPIQISAPLSEIFKSNNPHNKAKVFGTLIYIDQNKKSVAVPAQFRVKGYSSAMRCPFKKLELKFKKKDTVGTLFEGIGSIDLNTHCDGALSSDYPDMHAHREAVLYKMAQALEIPTYQVRKVLVQYRQTGLMEDRVESPFEAVFVEDKGDLLKRISAKEVKDFDADGAGAPEKFPNVLFALNGVESHKQIDLEDFAMITIFNEMIGNCDWHYPSVKDTQSLWNIKVLEVSKNHWVPLTHDFNVADATSGVVFCEPMSERRLVDEPTSQRLRQIFKNKKSEIYNLIESLGRDAMGKIAMKKIIDSFYERGL